MKQALASALIETQRKIVSTPLASRNIKGAQVLREVDSMSNGSVSDGTAGAGTPSRAATPEVSSHVGPRLVNVSKKLGPCRLLDPQVLKTAKMWRFQKLSKAESLWSTSPSPRRQAVPPKVS